MATTDSRSSYGKTKRYASSGALLVVGALALGHWLLSPHLGYLHAVERLEPIVAHMAEERERICDARDAKLEEVERLRSELVAAGDQFFTESQTEVFVRGLLPLIEATGCTVVAADFTGGGDAIAAPDANEPLGVVANTADVTVLGQHNQIAVLLERLQTHQPKVWIDACRVTSVGRGAVQLECDLALTTQIIRGKEKARDS